MGTTPGPDVEESCWIRGGVRDDPTDERLCPEKPLDLASDL